MSLPDFLGKDIEETLKKSQEEAVNRVTQQGTKSTGDVEIIDSDKNNIQADTSDN